MSEGAVASSELGTYKNVSSNEAEKDNAYHLSISFVSHFSLDEPDVLKRPGCNTSAIGEAYIFMMSSCLGKPYMLDLLLQNVPSCSSISAMIGNTHL